MVTPDAQTPACPGHASLQIDLVSGASAVTSAFATSPLKLLAPRPRGRSAWVYTSSFGGGLLAGDQTRLELKLGAGARGFLGTQASTKVYRNPSALPSGHTTHARLEPGSLLVFAPDLVQPFAGASYSQRQDFHLASDASLVLVDWFSSGREARGERWAFRHFESRNAVWRSSTAQAMCKSPAKDGDRLKIEASTGRAHSELVFLDSILFHENNGPFDSPQRTGRFNCFAMLLFLGPAVRDLADTLLADVAARPVTRRLALLCSASPLHEGALLRVAGEQVEVVARELQSHLAPLAAQLGDNPWARKR